MKRKKFASKINYRAYENLPCRNKSLQNIKGEKWKPIPHFEDYEISNYGRVKSLPREIYYSNGKVICKKESIILAGISPAPNYFMGDHSYQLGVHFQANGKIYRYSVARLVYQSFIKPIDEVGDKIYIIQKDGNGSNCHYKNLVAVSPIDKQKRIYIQNRNISALVG